MAKSVTNLEFSFLDSRQLTKTERKQIRTQLTNFGPIIIFQKRFLIEFDFNDNFCRIKIVRAKPNTKILFIFKIRKKNTSWARLSFVPLLLTNFSAEKIRIVNRIEHVEIEGKKIQKKFIILHQIVYSSLTNKMRLVTGHDLANNAILHG